MSLTAVVVVANKSGSMCSVTAGPAGMSYKALLAGLMIALAWVRRWPRTGRICSGHLGTQGRIENRRISFRHERCIWGGHALSNP